MNIKKGDFKVRIIIRYKKFYFTMTKFNSLINTVAKNLN